MTFSTRGATPLFSRHNLRLAAVSTAFLALSSQAFAGLGQTPSLPQASPQATVQAKSAAQSVARVSALSASTASTSVAAAPTGNWTVRQSQTADGGTLREYVGADGLVFAVAWRTSFLPDLSSLMGVNYTQRLEQAAQVATPAGPTRQISFAQSDFGVSAIARQHFSAGIAWLPALVPAGVSVDALRIN